MDDDYNHKKMLRQPTCKFKIVNLVRLLNPRVKVICISNNKRYLRLNNHIYIRSYITLDL